jgi:signal transduction histidine kinase/ligand-binding sensor domain-containing protein/CheY-like chemotaxis protein/AraC-like DNA-binding protein
MIYLNNKNLFFLICFIITILFSFNTNAQSIIFNHLTTNNGLSNNYVSDIIQDDTGFLWFATDDGLNRFDGYEFKVYRNTQDNKNSISDNTILSFSKDKKGNLWIGTKNGNINCYNPFLDKFKKWKIESDITNDNPITVIHIDKNNLVWIGTYRSGIYRLNPESGEIDHWVFRLDDPNSISNNYVSSIVEDNLGNYWVGTFNGLNKLRFNNSKIEIERFYSKKNNPNSLSDNLIWGITESAKDKNEFWIGTANGLTVFNSASMKFKRIEIPNPYQIQFGTGAGMVIEEIINEEQIVWINSFAGLLRYNVSKNSFERILADSKNPTGLSTNQINKIYKDRSGVLWVATNKGISYFSQKQSKFNNSFAKNDIQFTSSQLEKLSVNSIAKTYDGNLYIGTDKGLFYSVNQNGKTLLLKHPKLSSMNIWSLVMGKNDELWIGTYGDGLFRLDLKNNNLTEQNFLKNRIRSSSQNFIKSLFVDNNNLWVGYWGIGLSRLNLSTLEFTYWNHNEDNINSLSHDDVWITYQDRRSRIWIGTNGGGLNYFDKQEGGKFYSLTADLNGDRGLSSNSIYSILESIIKNQNINETILWIGTNNGLNKIIIDDTQHNPFSFPKIKSIDVFKTENGLDNNSIKSIVEDIEGNLWLGTSSGITFYDLNKNTFTNYSNLDGIIGVDFNFSSALLYNKNLILMGSTSGLNLFNPSAIRRSEFNPTVAITDFQIFNKSVEVDSNSVLLQNIIYTNHITLSHTQNVFSFMFTAFDYSHPGSINYAYIMEGFDQEWIQGGVRRFITYTNLNSGEYTFKVKSTNSDGVWCDNEKSIKVIITPPWWQTGWAILLYFAVFVLGVLAIIKFQNYRTRLQHELKFRELESYHLREIEQMKSRFFANLSHEFRTPLMLIKGPLEALLSGKIRENISDYYKLLLRNTEKLQQLIDQLLELSQLESESIPLKKETLDLVSVVNSCFESFKPVAGQKNISYRFNSDIDSALAAADKDKLEKIINNLLNNAFKFTPDRGNISVGLTVLKKYDLEFLNISIKDSGIGIAQDHQTKIFDRFYQADNSLKRNYGGSGIGLALVKELVTLQKWDIEVKSDPGLGTEFILTIPLIADKELTEVNQQQNNNYITEITSENRLINHESNEANTYENQDEKPLILFVEDSEDVRKYVYDLLKTDYDVLLAESGEVGINVTQINLPDLILSDVMMPGMDGFEFCKKIKSDWKTSHIPVILLTAKVAHQSKLDGLELGADDYITKPFDYKELLIRIKNLIDQRKRLKEKFTKEIIIPSELITNNSSDSEFIKKTIEVIEKNLIDENFNSDVLAKDLFVSRSHLTRKLHSITGQGPGEFIRNYKLKRAAQMIMQNKLSITQIAYEVGFGSPAQFTRAFQKHYNSLPSEYKQIKP